MTRFDFDEIFGTIVNRYCAQSVIGHPLTLYGSGGQRRSFISLIDSIQCLTLTIENPPEKGTYRIFNQIDEVHQIGDLGRIIAEKSAAMGLRLEIIEMKNPRVESESHHYAVDSDGLRRLGFRRTRSIKEEVEIMLKDLARFKERIDAKKHLMQPTVSWKS